MNVLFLTLMYHPDDLSTVTRNTRDGLQNQINNYQWAFVEGIQANLSENETLSICNALPVGVFPIQYRKLFLPAIHRAVRFEELGCLNLPYLKQRMRARGALHVLKRWMAASPENRNVLIYSLYQPYLWAVAKAKRLHSTLRATVIVTDLPNERGIASGRTGLLKRLEYRIGDEKIKLCSSLDGFVLLTQPMADALPVGDKPCLIIEGLISDAPQVDVDEAVSTPDDRPAVLYSGTLNRELGIPALLEAFRAMPGVQLWLCGKGDMQTEVQRAADECPNIRAFGFVSQTKALALQAKATALINPRMPHGLFTRYSFPSKTLEYMRSGKPVLCYRLEGIPREYDGYLSYIGEESPAGICLAVETLLARPQAEREAMGERARSFVREAKNSRAQGKRLVQWMRSLAGEPQQCP